MCSHFPLLQYIEIHEKKFSFRKRKIFFYINDFKYRLSIAVSCERADKYSSCAFLYFIYNRTLAIHFFSELIIRTVNSFFESLIIGNYPYQFLLYALHNSQYMRAGGVLYYELRGGRFPKYW